VGFVVLLGAVRIAKLDGSASDAQRVPFPDAPVGIGGLLGLLCRVLVLWQPLSFGLVASGALNSLSLRGLPLALAIVGRLAVAAFGVAAGLALWRRRPGAVAMAATSLVLSAAADIFVYTTPYFPHNRPPGDATLILGASLAWYGAWLMYLWRSKRVRNTFGL